MTLLLGAYLSVALARLALSSLNLRHQAREGSRIPSVLQGEASPEQMQKSQRYTLDRARFGLLRSLVSAALVAAFLFAGGLGYYDQWLTSRVRSELGGGTLFFVGLTLLGAIVEIPFDWYADFHLEARHGFNRKTPGLWWSDWLKQTALSLTLVAAVSSGALALVGLAPLSWWLWVSILVGASSVLLMFVSPYLIEPLFHEMKPLTKPSLEAEVQALAERAGVSVKRILTVDASRRSSHSNAYFTGLGRTKRVVLFDTLLEHMSNRQIVAVLAHELGHWKKHHVLQRLLVSQGLVTLAAYLAFQLSTSPSLPGWVGLAQASFSARMLILASAASVCVFVMTPCFSAWSRYHEREADQFATELHGQPSDLADALSTLGRENLAGLHPHPLFAFVYYSHPPLTERIAALRHGLGRGADA